MGKSLLLRNPKEGIGEEVRRADVTTLFLQPELNEEEEDPLSHFMTLLLLLRLAVREEVVIGVLILDEEIEVAEFVFVDIFAATTGAAAAVAALGEVGSFDETDEQPFRIMSTEGVRLNERLPFSYGRNI